MQVVVDHHHRGHSTGTEAAPYAERKESVWCGLTHVDAQLMLERLKQFIASTDITSRPQADTNHVGAARDGREKGIECHNPSDLTVRFVEDMSNPLDD